MKQLLTILFFIFPAFAQEYLQLATHFEAHYEHVLFPRMAYQLELLECLQLTNTFTSEPLGDAQVWQEAQKNDRSCYLLETDSPEQDVFDITASLQRAGFSVNFEHTLQPDENASMLTRMFYQSFQHDTFSKQFVTLYSYLDYGPGLLILVEESTVQ
jgi:hypothetical protein